LQFVFAHCKESKLEAGSLGNEAIALFLAIKANLDACTQMVHVGSGWDRAAVVGSTLNISTDRQPACRGKTKSVTVEI